MQKLNKLTVQSNISWADQATSYSITYKYRETEKEREGERGFTLCGRPFSRNPDLDFFDGQRLLLPFLTFCDKVHENFYKSF